VGGWIADRQPLERNKEWMGCDMKKDATKSEDAKSKDTKSKDTKSKSTKSKATKRNATKKKKDVTLLEVIKNNVYAIKLIWEISPRRVIHMAFLPFIGYCTWMFYSTYFIRYVVNAIETDLPFRDILIYIATVCVITMILQIYATYVGNVTVPLDDVKVYSQLYARMYKKAENVELSCFEDSEFYNK
jgi:hypothetical protein